MVLSFCISVRTSLTINAVLLSQGFVLADFTLNTPVGCVVGTSGAQLRCGGKGEAKADGREEEEKRESAHLLLRSLRVRGGGKQIE